MSNPPAPSAGDVAATFCATVVDEWFRRGVRHAVISPGSRSTPMATAILRDGRLVVDVFHDERSASFCALGIAKATGTPAVLLCTSGTAAAQFHAAVVEADLSAVPMLVCTADRPPELHGIGAPQTIDQQNLYGDSVRTFIDAGVPTAEARGTWRDLAARCLRAACGSTPGPVQLNLPFREPLLGTSDVLPPVEDRDDVSAEKRAGDDVQTVPLTAELDRDLLSMISGRRGVIVAGGGSGAGVVDLARALRWPVFADVRSGARGVASEVLVTVFDPILRDGAMVARCVPDFIVRFGEPPASKVLSQWCASSGATVVQVGADERIFDPERVVSRFATAELDESLRGATAAVVGCDEAWLARWMAAEGAARAAVDEMLATEWGEPAVAATVAGSLTPGSSLVVSSSMPIRDLEWFAPLMKGVRVHANRGANGIDGVVSTAVGVARGSSTPTTLLIGDIAFLHDVNGLLALAQRDLDLRIVVVNNDGGAIFGFLPQAAALSADDFERLFGTPHGTDLAQVAAAHHLVHVTVGSRTELAAALARRGPTVIEVPTDRSTNVAVHDRIYERVRAALADARIDERLTDERLTDERLTDE